MLHLTLLILLKGCVFQPGFGCAHIVYFDRLSGACHTRISYHYILSNTMVVEKADTYLLIYIFPKMLHLISII